MESKEDVLMKEHNEMMKGYQPNLNVSFSINTHVRFTSFERFSIYEDSSLSKNTFSNSNALIKRL
jgi:hypothetical protein